MKLFTILVLSTIGMVYCASLETNPQCSICTTAVDWMRSNENVLNTMKYDGEVDRNFIEVIESDLSSENACGLLAMCDTSAEALDYLTNLKKNKRKNRTGIPDCGGVDIC